MRSYDSFYIGGEWVKASGSDTIEVTDSATEEVVATVPAGTAADVDAAVAAARGAFESWSQTTVDVRAKYLRDLGAALAGKYGELVDVIVSEVGSPKVFAELVQAGLGVSDWNNYADIIESFEFERQEGNSLIVREPIGVVAAITPWNYPLFLIACKVGPALAAGCTVVLKPSQVTPLNAFLLAEAIDEAGFPPGVFNLVSGRGSVMGNALTSHLDVDMVSFTGSGPAGKEVSKSAADTVKRVALELGGKSANVILDDADPAAIAQSAVFGCFINSGQTCSALTRVLIPRSREQEFVDAIVEAAQQVQLVDPKQDGLDFATSLGPLVSKSQQESVREYIQSGIDEGATLAVGGPEQPEDFPTGFYVKPTVFVGVDPNMTIAQEEIFGPVLSVITYEDDDDAVRIANGTVYGLAGGVQGGDLERAKSVARRMRTGQVDINGGAFNARAPFGGYKQSGNGRERGEYGIEEFLEIKAMQLP
jgi:acyl-CoA reductase-like NAD-dependent aldehyde dehydrogenase